MTIREPVPQGPLKTPFYPRVEKIDDTKSKRYFVADFE